MAKKSQIWRLLAPDRIGRPRRGRRVAHQVRHPPIAVSVSLDTIYKPATNRKLFSDAYDELFLEKAKQEGAYAAAPSVYDTIKQIESRVSKGRDQLDQLIRDAKSAAELALKEPKNV
jgi:hypothetical protein